MTNPTVIDGATLLCPITTTNPVARQNIDTIIQFFSVYLKDKDRFYSFWVDDDPAVITPFVSDDVAVCHVVTHGGWDAIKRFWDPIFDEMTGRFDWFVDAIIPGEDPNVIVTKSHSEIDVFAGTTWGSKQVKYSGRYVQIFTFDGGKVKSFEEYYDTALLNAAYG